MGSSQRALRRWTSFLLAIKSLLVCSSSGFVPAGLVPRGRNHQHWCLLPMVHDTQTYRIVPANGCASSTEGSRRRLGSPATRLFGRGKNRSSSSRQEPPLPSMLRSLFGSAFGGGDDGTGFLAQFTGSRKKTSVLEAGAEAALVLGDKRRRKEWTRDVGRQFPWIPAEVLSACTDGLATAFASIAPRDLKRALRPGGLEEARSRIGRDLVRSLEDQPVVRNLPLPTEDRKKLLSQIVGLSLEFFLRDLESAMAEPSAKLLELDREVRDLQARMPFWKLAWYRLRHRPRSTLFVALLSLWSLCATLALARQHPDVPGVLLRRSRAWFVSAAGSLWAPAAKRGGTRFVLRAPP